MASPHRYPMDDLTKKSPHISYIAPHIPHPTIGLARTLIIAKEPSPRRACAQIYNNPLYGERSWAKNASSALEQKFQIWLGFSPARWWLLKMSIAYTVVDDYFLMMKPIFSRCAIFSQDALFFSQDMLFSTLWKMRMLGDWLRTLSWNPFGLLSLFPPIWPFGSLSSLFPRPRGLTPLKLCYFLHEIQRFVKI